MNLSRYNYRSHNRIINFTFLIFTGVRIDEVSRSCFHFLLSRRLFVFLSNLIYIVNIFLNFFSNTVTAIFTLLYDFLMRIFLLEKRNHVTFEPFTNFRIHFQNIYFYNFTFQSKDNSSRLFF